MSHHLGLTIDDFESAYAAIRARTDVTFGWSLVELPSGQVQLYFRDPGGNLIELNWPDVGTLDRSKYPDADAAGRPDPAVGGGTPGGPYLGPGEARSAAATRALPKGLTEARR